MTQARTPLSYADAGVSIAAGNQAVGLMKRWVEYARRPEVVGGIGGFAGLFDATSLTRYRRPLLATSADGVGTKVVIAQRMDVHTTIGFDLVGMLVDDLVVCGAEPLFLTDYIACGQVVPERIAGIVEGIARACVAAGCALIGGETAEHPGLLEPDEYDLAGSTTGVVEASELLGPQRVRAGDVVIAMASSGLHANGFSLVRRVVSDAGWSLERTVPELGRTLGEELLEPTRIYARPCLALARSGAASAMAHITGGGFAANLARVVPESVSVQVDRATWRPLPIFDLLRDLGRLGGDDVEATFNMGVGMAALVRPDHVETVLRRLRAEDLAVWVCGEVTADPGGSVGLHGRYA